MPRLVIRILLLHMFAASRQVIPHNHHSRHWLVQPSIRVFLVMVTVLLLVVFFVALAAALAADCVHLLVLGELVDHQFIFPLLGVASRRLDGGDVRYALDLNFLVAGHQARLGSTPYKIIAGHPVLLEVCFFEGPPGSQEQFVFSNKSIYKSNDAKKNIRPASQGQI